MECSFCHTPATVKKWIDKDGKEREKSNLTTVLDPTIPVASVNSLACESCDFLISKIAEYKKKYYEAHDSLDRMKSELNMFRSVMLSPATMGAIVDEPTKEDMKSYVKRKVSGLEVLRLDQLLDWMETFEFYAKEISSIINRKATKEELKEHLENKTKKAIKETVKIQNEEKKKQNDGLLGTYTASEKKVIQGMMKTLGLNEKNALNHLHTMGMLTNVTMEKKA